MSPLKKHMRGKGLTSGEKIQIVNVYKTRLKDNPKTTVRERRNIVNYICYFCRKNTTFLQCVFLLLAYLKFAVNLSELFKLVIFTV